MVNTDNVEIMGENVHIIEKRPEALLVASKEIFLKMTADKTKHMLMPLDHNAERNQYVKADEISIEMVDEFRYVGTT
jgi:hypothetical protein